MITLILFLTALNTILILYFHWQQEQRNIKVMSDLEILKRRTAKEGKTELDWQLERTQEQDD